MKVHCTKISASAAPLALLVAALLAGCGTTQSVNKTRERNEADVAAAERGLAQLAESARRPVLDHDVGKPFVAGTSVPLAREVTLPPSLRRGVRVELLFRGASRVDLTTAAHALGQALGVPVRVRPDALAPQSAFAPRAGGAALAAGPATGAAAAPAAPAGAGAAAALPLPIADGSGLINMQLGEMGGAEMLDYLCAQTGNYWRFEGGVVEIYRLVTRTFEIHAQQGRTSVSTGLGRSGQQGGSFDASSQTKVEQSGLDAIAEIKTAVEGMLSRGGTVVVGNGTLVVTDTKEVVDRVGAYIDRENRALTRRVRLLFEAIEVSAKDANETGINWDLVFQRLARQASGGLISQEARQTTPVTLVSQTAGQTTFTLTGSTPFSGSQLLLRALSDVGSVANHTRVPMVTINRRPVQYAVRTNFDYVSSIQVSTVASSGGTTTAPAITQKEETVGTVLTVTPSAFEGGQILMNLAYDNTILRSLEPYSAGASGTGATLSTVQQKTIDGSGTVQSVAMRSGQTLVISGIDKLASQYDQRRLDKQIPLVFGGSDRTRSSRSTTVLLVTAVSEDGI